MRQSVIVIATHRKKGVLLLRRGADHKEFPNQWCFPGGKADWITETIEGAIPQIQNQVGRWELPAEAAFREFEEETCIKAVGMRDLPFHMSDGKYIVRVFHVVLNDEQLIEFEQRPFPNREHDKFGWFNYHYPIGCGPMTRWLLGAFEEGAEFDMTDSEEVLDDLPLKVDIEQVFDQTFADDLAPDISEEYPDDSQDYPDDPEYYGEIETDLIRKMSFVKEEDNKWYIELPEWTGEKGDLQMVMGADTMLDLLDLSGSKRVELIVAEADTEGGPWMVQLRKTEDRSDVGGGADYTCSAPEFGVADFKVWLCNVTHWIYGYMPDNISLAYCTEEVPESIN